METLFLLLLFFQMELKYVSKNNDLYKLKLKYKILNKTQTF